MASKSSSVLMPSINSARSYRYTNVAGIPASNYTGTFQVKPKGAGSTVEWRAQFLADDSAISSSKRSLHAFQDWTGKPEAAFWSRQMTVVEELDGALTLTTDGEIAIRNLESARRRSWTRFFEHPTHNGAAEAVVEHEQLTLQFVGDVTALDRVEFLATEFSQVDATSARVALTQAQVASMAHRFSDARQYLAQAENDGAPKADVERLRLNIDQACGVNLDVVLDARSRLASETYGLRGFRCPGVSVGRSSRLRCRGRCLKQALQAFRDVSPFPIARAASTRRALGRTGTGARADPWRPMVSAGTCRPADVS